MKTTVMLKFDDETVARLDDYCKRNGISQTKDYNGNSSDSFDYHITLYYTDSPNILTDINVNIPKFQVYLSGFEYLGENKDIPVLLLNPLGKLSDLFKHFGNEYNLKSQWPLFKPHISLSYDKNKIEIHELPRFPLTVSSLHIVKKSETVSESNIINMETSLSGTDFNVYKNPTKDEIKKQILKSISKQLYFIYDRKKDDLYIWNPMYGIHYSIASELNLKDYSITNKGYISDKLDWDSKTQNFYIVNNVKDISLKGHNIKTLMTGSELNESELVVKPLFLNKTDSSITVSINNKKYEYFFTTTNVSNVYDKFKTLLKYSPGKALNYLKTVSDNYQLVNEETLNKPYRLPSGSKQKFGVKVKSDSGNTIEVKFGDPNMEIKRDDPKRLKSFRARHDCENKTDKTKAGFWSCKMWQKNKSVSDVLKEKVEEYDGVKIFVNPTYVQILNLINKFKYENRQIRFFIDLRTKPTLYVWDDFLIHNNFGYNYLGMEFSKFNNNILKDSITGYFERVDDNSFIYDHYENKPIPETSYYRKIFQKRGDFI